MMTLVKLIPLLLLLSTYYSSSAICYIQGSDESVSELPQAAERIRNEPQSVWVEFVQLAQDYKPLNLGQGFPDFAAPQYLVESLHNATRQLDQSGVLSHQYTRSFGHPRFVRALRDYYHQLRGFERLSNERDQILVTVGAYEALFTAIMAFVNPGDEVLVVDPAFDAYAPMVAMAGGSSVFIPLRQTNSSKGDERRQLSSDQFVLDMDEFESKISNKTRMFVLNTPNNPLGKAFSRKELEALAKLCIKHNILVLADEVYEQFNYQPEGHVSMASLAGMWERTITVGSAGKTFSVTGWKIGWAVGPAHLIKYLQLVHQTAVYTVATPLQEAVARTLEHEMVLIKAAAEGQYWRGLRLELEQKRNRMASALARARLEPIVPQAGYFMLADYRPFASRFKEAHLADNTTSGQSSSFISRADYKFARWLARTRHLQGIPGSAFYSAGNKHLGENFIRFCFIKSNETLAKLERLLLDS